MAKAKFVITAALATAVVAAAAPQEISAQSAAHRHIGHVGDSFSGTPDDAGLLATAQAEAEVAAQHAGLAAGSDDLAGIESERLLRVGRSDHPSILTIWAKASPRFA